MGANGRGHPKEDGRGHDEEERKDATKAVRRDIVTRLAGEGKGIEVIPLLLADASLSPVEIAKAGEEREEDEADRLDVHEEEIRRLGHPVHPKDEGADEEGDGKLVLLPHLQEETDEEIGEDHGS